MPRTGTQRKHVTPAELVRYAYRAGFGRKGTGDTVHIGPLMIAVTLAFAENATLQVDAVNTNTDGSHDLGLWQINDYWWVERGPHFDRNRLLSDPQYNANAAFEVYQTQGWTAWSTYKGPSYAGAHKRAFKAVTGTLPAMLGQEPIPGNFATALDEKARGIGGGIADMLSFIAEGGLLRIASVIGGGLAVLIGLLMLASETTPLPIPKVG